MSRQIVKQSRFTHTPFNPISKSNKKQTELIFNRAYRAKSGYATGYVDGKKVAAVAGTRTLNDWSANITDLWTPRYRQLLTRNKIREYNYYLKRDKPDYVIGHSRGAKYVSQLNIPTYKKIGLDGAMLLSTARDKHRIINYRQKQLFDYGISGRFGKRNKDVILKHQPVFRHWKYNKKFHFSYR